MREFNFGQVAVTLIDQSEKMPELAGYPVGTAVRYYGNGSVESDYYERKLASVYRVFSDDREDIRLNIVFGVGEFPAGDKTVFILSGGDLIQQILELNSLQKTVYAFAISGIGITDNKDFASAFGETVSKLFLLTDYRVYTVCTGRVYETKRVESIRSEIVAAYKEFSPDSITKIAFALSNLKNFPPITSGERQMERVIGILFDHEQRKQIPAGVARFVCAAVLNKICKCFLLTEFGMVDPPDNNLRMEEISDYLGLSENNILRLMLPQVNQKKLNEIMYSLRFYKSELLAELCFNELIFRRAVSKLKKMLPACGFEMFNCMDVADLRLALALAPDLSCGTSHTFTGIMKSVGVLDSFL